MGERKVLNKYYPADFDPSKLPRFRQQKHQQMKVRMSLPMTIRCHTCGQYLDRGKKFNMRKEQVADETYLTIPIFRFYFKCTNCCSENIFKTDPQNSHYTVETGPNCYVEEDETKESRKRARDHEEDKDDAMKSLENRTVESKREMDRVVALDELMRLKSRQAKVKSDELLGAALMKDPNEDDKKISYEAMAKVIYSAALKDRMKRVSDESDDEDEE